MIPIRDCEVAFQPGRSRSGPRSGNPKSTVLRARIGIHYYPHADQVRQTSRPQLLDNAGAMQRLGSQSRRTKPSELHHPGRARYRRQRLLLLWLGFPDHRSSSSMRWLAHAPSARRGSPREWQSNLRSDRFRSVTAIRVRTYSARTLAFQHLTR
jgi:hypothetical protein